MTSLPFWVTLGLIFVLRLISVALGSLRMLMVFRGYRAASWFISLGESLIFIIAVQQVLTGSVGLWEKLAYAAGYATGTILGMWLEERLALGYSNVRIISSRQGPRLAHILRSEGFAITEIPGRGLEGTVGVLECAVPRKQVPEVLRLVQQIDPQAFITIEEIRPPMRGHFRA